MIKEALLVGCNVGAAKLRGDSRKQVMNWDLVGIRG